MTTKSPDLCSFPHCRKIAVITYEGKPLCNEHYYEASDRKLTKFKEDQARTRTFYSFYEEGIYQFPNPKMYGWCD